MKVVFLGAGNLATQLAQAFYQKGIIIAQIYSRTEKAAKTLADKVKSAYTNDLSAVYTLADVYIYALKDDVLSQIVSRVSAPNALHLHTAGSMSLSVFGADKPRCGVLYPMQTFSKNKSVDFAKIPIFIEAAQVADSICIQTLAKKISSQIYNANTEQRRKIHLAAVFACNFTNCMYAIAEKLLQDADLPFRAMLALIDETAEKVHEINPLNAQTGPAVRGDINVVNSHLAMLTDDKQQTIYRVISEYIQQNCCICSEK